MTGTRQEVKARLNELLSQESRTKDEKREIFALQTRLHELRQAAPQTAALELETELGDEAAGYENEDEETEEDEDEETEEDEDAMV